jgi:hypothetical protein
MAGIVCILFSPIFNTLEVFFAYYNDDIYLGSHIDDRNVLSVLRYMACFGGGGGGAVFEQKSISVRLENIALFPFPHFLAKNFCIILYDQIFSDINKFAFNPGSVLAGCTICRGLKIFSGCWFHWNFLAPPRKLRKISLAYTMVFTIYTLCNWFFTVHVTVRRCTTSAIESRYKHTNKYVE